MKTKEEKINILKAEKQKIKEIFKETKDPLGVNIAGDNCHCVCSC